MAGKDADVKGADGGGQNVGAGADEKGAGAGRTGEGLSPDFPLGEPNTAFAQFFDGQSYLAPLGDDQLHASNVTLEPGCRNHWHIHHGGGQVLICIAGRGWYQEWG